jgi:hypothetical protein
MARFYSSSVILLVLFIAAWKTTLVASHAKPAQPELDYGRRYDETFSVLNLSPLTCMR